MVRLVVRLWRRGLLAAVALLLQLVLLRVVFVNSASQDREQPLRRQPRLERRKGQLIGMQRPQDPQVEPADRRALRVRVELAAPGDEVVGQQVVGTGSRAELSKNRVQRAK